MCSSLNSMSREVEDDDLRGDAEASASAAETGLEVPEGFDEVNISSSEGK